MTDTEYNEGYDSKSISEFHRKSQASYDEYLMAMRRIHHTFSTRSSIPNEMLSPRERHRNRDSQKKTTMECVKGTWSTVKEATRIGIIASMVPDEIIYQHYDHSVRRYETALMFIDVSGFTELCEGYTKAGHGGPSKLTQVLNSYIGAMVQEILTHNGDVLKFSGDAFLSMWKKTPRLTMQDVVHTAIDCGLIIQKNYGSYRTDVGVKLKVKIAISAGVSHFSIIGGENITQMHYVIVGQPVWDVKMAEYMSNAGDVLTSASAWIYVNEAEYCTHPCGDGRHTKVLGVGATWKRVERLQSSIRETESPSFSKSTPRSDDEIVSEINYREFSLRPAVIAAMRSSWWPGLRRFMVTPVLRAVDNDEPMDFLTEVRRVVVVFLNIITKTVTESVLIGVVNDAYKCVSSVTSESGGLVNKVSMFDKDMMFLVVFGLRGLKHEDEAQKALQCAFQLKENLNDRNITTVSIGVTSGTTYCGVVGHVLRREYTVIGPAVNKAARLMISYPNKVTCDKETFLRSKLEQEFFRLMEAKPLKGIAKPGPIYEFNLTGWPERLSIYRHPLLGRNEELRKYKATLHNAIEQQHQVFTRYRDHKYGMAFLGPKLVGKRRLVEECMHITPNFLRVEKVVLTESEKVPYKLFRLILTKAFPGGNSRSGREYYENRIRYNIDVTSASPLQIYAINMIFDCRFPLPENYQYSGDILNEFSVKNIIKEICKNNFTSLWVCVVEEAQHADNESWRILILLLETKTIFLLMTITDAETLSPTANSCLASNMIVKIPLGGIDRFYHAALACQLLDVQAIPADLEKVIESASGGMPGWIQNFVISLVQHGALSVVTVSRNEAIESRAVMPSLALLQRADCDINPLCDDPLMRRPSYQSIYSIISVSVMSRQESMYTIQDTETVQMAVLDDSYNFDDIKVDMTMDAIILKTYDSLTPFEKMLLKCGSVLGDVFSRRMLLHLLQSDSPRKVAEAVAKLFAIRVLECEGGDFTRDTSLVLVHPAPALPATTKPPYCACLGTRQPPHCRDLPMYAFCGYMRFRHTLFRTTTYELLTESQKGLIEESEELKRTRLQICALSAETRIPGEQEPSIFAHDSMSDFTYNLSTVSSFELLETEGTVLSRILDSKGVRESTTVQIYRKDKRVRSFSSLVVEHCECLSILLSVYCQIIDHCRGAGEYDKLFEAYLEYANVSIINLNIPQAIRLLFEVENFVLNEKSCTKEIRKSWMKEFQLASIYSMRSVCMMESGDLNEARKQLLEAMKLYSDPFPTSKHWVRIHNIGASIRQAMTLYIAPNRYIGTERGVVGYFYEDIAKTLNRLYRLFDECNETENATLAAKCALNYALRTNSNFRLLCVCYGNMIATYRQKQKFSMCVKLEKRAMDLCHRKRGQLDVTEVHAVCYLYTSIFLFYVEYGKKMESLEFGLSVMHMMSGLTDLNTRQMLVLWMLKLLLSDLRIHDMVAIMREFFYMTDHYDLSSETWYYFYAMMIMLDTGYCVESYGTCEKFYIKRGDAILRSKTPEAAWNFFVCMWLITIRIGAWERSILWEEKIKQIMSMKFEQHEFNIMMLVRLVEGLLITLVNEMDNRNIKKIIILEKAVKAMFIDLCRACKRAPMYKPRYQLLFAYHHYIGGRKLRAYSYLNKARETAKQCSHGTLMIWAEHTRNHWKGTLSPKYIDYWANHVEPDNLLDYRDFHPGKSKIVPYTLPLPRDLEK
ncbi:adenylate cyclase type 10 isoform X2 [Manduca sexta]|uniref:adenylate cyclase type 10 isoform X2 n=1 Tax=Manduca sexta TaxID=7130 RepID=UPI00188DF623|nr:adenylate cyclase type 10 isoform X2 [Manduca sexta]